MLRIHDLDAVPVGKHEIKPWHADHGKPLRTHLPRLHPGFEGVLSATQNEVVVLANGPVDKPLELRRGMRREDERLLGVRPSLQMRRRTAMREDHGLRSRNHIVTNQTRRQGIPFHKPHSTRTVILLGVFDYPDDVVEFVQSLFYEVVAKDAGIVPVVNAALKDDSVALHRQCPAELRCGYVYTRRKTPKYR